MPGSRAAAASPAAGKVEVTEGDRQTLTAKKQVIVATGSQPRSVPGIEIDRQRIITSDEAIGMKEVPKSIAIMGSGAVGVEFASIFRRFGSEVTIIELLPRLVPIEDEAVSAELERSFKKQGIKVLTGTKVTSARPGAGGVELEAQGGDGKASKISAEYLLVATGRGPVTSGLGAEDLQLRMERGYIHVDRDFRTSVEGVSAIGDVITFDTPGHPQLAHLSSAEGIALAERIAGHESRAINYDQVPGCTYCDPEIGSVGLTEKEAQARGFDVRVGTFKFSVLARARIAAETEGFVKIVAEKKYDEVLGVHMIGPRIDRARRRSDAGAASRVHGRRADPDHSRTSDDVGGGWRGRPCGARGGDSCVVGGSLSVDSCQLPVSGSSTPATLNRQLETGNLERSLMTNVVMPQMGESIAEGTIVRWIKKVGDQVDRDEPLFEISTDKVDAEIPAPAAGVLTDIKVKEGETVPVNSVVAVIGVAGEAKSAAEAPAAGVLRAGRAGGGGRSARGRVAARPDEDDAEGRRGAAVDR